MRHVILILFWGLTTTIQAATPSVSTDSIHTLKHVLKIHLSYPDSTLRLLDTMEETNTAPPFPASSSTCHALWIAQQTPPGDKLWTKSVAARLLASLSQILLTNADMLC